MYTQGGPGTAPHPPGLGSSGGALSADADTAGGEPRVVGSGYMCVCVCVCVSVRLQALGLRAHGSGCVCVCVCV